MGKEIPEFRVNGVITDKKLFELNLMPPDERLKKGPVVIMECPEEIPCNICVSACPFNAIQMKTIYTLPVVDWDKCIGCGVCVSLCPGLAIFAVDLSKEDAAYVTVPHEFLPVPKKGDEVTILSREGKPLGKAKVVKVWERNMTYIVTVEVPKNLALEVRAIWMEKK